MRKDKVTKNNFTPFGRAFGEPFSEKNYYETRTYDDVFKAVQEDIDNNVYTSTYPADGICLTDDVDLTSCLKLFVPRCPDLFESDTPDARKLVAHFGKLINTAFYERNSEERQGARDVISGIVGSRPRHAEWSKIYIPPFLSINDMVTYIHRITKYLKSQVCKDDLSLDMSPGDFSDPRLKDLASRDKEDIRMLFRKPKALTLKLVADFLGLTPGGLRQKLKEEKHFPNTYHLERE